MKDAFSEWCRRLRASDGSACTELFREMHAPLIRYAATLTKDRDAAYDVVQEAFIKLWNHRERLDPSRSLKAYLYTIVRNTAYDQLVRKGNVFDGLGSLEESEDPGQASTDDALIAGELKQRIHAWIRELPPRRQEAFRLSRFQGFTHDEIAQIMGLESRTVTHHIMLALQHLRDRLATYQAA